MKLPFLAIILIALAAGCSKNEDQSKTYTPKPLTVNTTFNEYPEKKADSMTIVKTTVNQKEEFSVKFRDTTVLIATDPADKKKTAGKFSFAQFVNTQKTSALVHIADSAGLSATTYLIALKNHELQVISLYRPSNGSQDKKFSEGINRLSGAGYLVDNDFFVTNVNSKVYLIRRQNPQERIQGQYFLMSPDRQTIAFLVDKSIYQVNYPTDEVLAQPLAANSPKEVSAIYAWIQASYSFHKDKKGVSFLKYNDNNRVVDIKEFK